MLRLSGCLLATRNLSQPFIQQTLIHTERDAHLGVLSATGCVIIAFMYAFAFGSFSTALRCCNAVAPSDRNGASDVVTIKPWRDAPVLGRPIRERWLDEGSTGARRKPIFSALVPPGRDSDHKEQYQTLYQLLDDSVPTYRVDSLQRTVAKVAKTPVCLVIPQTLEK